MRPLPHVLREPSGWVVDDKTDYDRWLDEKAEEDPYEIKGMSERVKNKQQLWECKLLDLTLVQDKAAAVAVKDNEIGQKQLFQNYFLEVLFVLHKNLLC